LGTIPVKNLPEKDFTKKQDKLICDKYRTNLFWTKTKTGHTYFRKNRTNLFWTKTHRLILTKTGQTFWTKTEQTYFFTKQDKLIIGQSFRDSDV
jgi:hypothetical protein